MRLFTRFTAISGLCICTLLYLVRYLPSLGVKTELKNHWSKRPRRLIVFGDSWSDDGEYPIDPPREELRRTRDPAQGKVWTEWLCSYVSISDELSRFRILTSLQINCIHHDNFARSLPFSWVEGYRGAVVNSDLLNSTTSSEKTGAEPLADLRTQIDQWIRYEKKIKMTSRVREKERKGTIFTVWFSLWDLWYYSRATNEEASKAVSATVETLFEQLDRLADNWPGELKVVMPEAMDPTFLPGWQLMRTGPQGNDQKADEQRNAVMLVQQWNAALDHLAQGWDKGQLYIYNTNEWMLDQVREQQLVQNDMVDHNGLGQAGSPWDNVQAGCVGSMDRSHAETNDTLAGDPRCSNPSKFLFW